MLGRSALLVALLVPALCGAGCSSDDEAGPTTTTTTTTSRPVPTVPPEDEQTLLVDQVRRYSDAYLGNNPREAFTRLSSRCQVRVTIDEMQRLVTEAWLLYGGAQIASLTVDELSGNLARVTYRYNRPPLDQEREPWVREAGVWLNDDC